MPLVNLGDRSVYLEDTGTGEPVLLVPGTGARGRSWTHQIPALLSAGYRVVAMDNRGSGPGGPVPAELSVNDLVTDVADVAAKLFDVPFRIVGASMGSYVVQEYLLTAPPVRQAALVAARGRPDTHSRALSAAERALADAGVALPPAYDIAVRALQYLSPATRNDETALRDWLDLFELTPSTPNDPGLRAQLAVEIDGDRLGAYAGIDCSCLVLSFADDVITPPARGRELAAVIPGARYAEIADAGHYGHLERPGDVNATLLSFFASG